MPTRHQKIIPSRQYHASMARKPFPSETQERFIVRFPDGMRDRIADVARENNRSMNAEIVARLEGSFIGAPPRLKSDNSEAERIRNQLIELVERKRKNEQVLAHLKEAGLPIAEVAAVFNRELAELSPQVITLAKQLRELGEVDAAKQIAKKTAPKPPAN